VSEQAEKDIQTWWSSVGILVFYKKLPWFVSELPENIYLKRGGPV
jgi:hypothetical protein